MQASEDGLRLRYLICFYYVVVSNGDDREAYLDEAQAIDMQLSRIAGRQAYTLTGCIAGHHQLEAMQSLGLSTNGLQGQAHFAGIIASGDIQLKPDEFISKFKKGGYE